MIKGLYAAASAMIANMERQKTLAHNIANMETNGFKQIMTTLTDWEETSVVFSPGNISHTGEYDYIGAVGLGTDIGTETTDFTEGAIAYTGNTFDLAINGNGFFTVEKDGEKYYTRDGRFSRDSSNNLVTSDGYYVLNDGGQHITLPDGDISIAQDGTIATTEETIGKIGVATFKNLETDLTRFGGNLFIANTDPSTEVEKGVVDQGYLEASNINISQIMTQMVQVSKAYTAAQKMVTAQDTLLGETISKLGA